MVETESSGEKKGDNPVVRTAEAPRQAMNVDLCFVPATHEAEQKLPAVSGSSGRLVIEQPKEEKAERQWPGRVFEDESLDYTEAMMKFVVASKEQPELTPGVESDKNAAMKDRKRALRQEERQLQFERRTARQQHKQEDAAWKAFKAERKQQKDKQENLSRQERKVQNERWQSLRQQRRETLKKRNAEDQEWRHKRNYFREIWSQLPIVTSWIAILVITDNCTRQCVGLPLFVAGSKVTADMIVDALKVLLPPDLLFLISDRGTHFTAKAFQVLIRSEGFIHVLIARHRPQSNGIAERFVRTIKEWLKDKNWEDDKALSVLLEQFLAEYNDRPHQGLSIPGLSPNEFANRTWLM